MSNAVSPRPSTYADYLVAELASVSKHEFYEGLVYAMSGGTLAHAEVSAAISGELRMLLTGKPCRVFSSDARVRSLVRDGAFYPDISVACGDLLTHPSDSDALTNPCLIAEVLSPSTEGYDRGKKFEAYRSIESLKAYLLADPEHRTLELYIRTERGTWELFVPDASGNLALPPWGVSLQLAHVFGDFSPRT
jgi:Uma2 family endonuclease